MTVAVRQLQRPIVKPFSILTDVPPKERQVRPDRPEKKQRGESLPALLARIGINGSAGQRLLAREELLADPAPVLAWWWYCLVQEDLQLPAALAYSCLASNVSPRSNFLELARAWPRVSAGDRAKIEKMLLRYPGCEKLAARWSKSYPGLTAGAFVALMWLYAYAPTELGYPQNKGDWAKL